MYRYVFMGVVALCLWPDMARAACPAAPSHEATSMVMRFVPPVGGHAGTLTASAVADKTLEGTLLYDTTDRVLKLCDGVSWLTLAQNMASGDFGMVQFSDGVGGLLSDEALYWDTTNKRLGVGTAEPAQNIHIHQDLQAAFRTSWNNVKGYGEWVAYQDGAYYGGLSIFGSEYGTGANAMRWRNGFVLTAAVNNLGNIYFRTRTGGTYQHRLYIANAGNVGVGTIDPAATLDVNGHMRLSMNSAAPAACAATNRGAIALTSAAQMCICTGAGWQVANTVEVCSW